MRQQENVYYPQFLLIFCPHTTSYHKCLVRKSFLCVIILSLNVFIVDKQLLNRPRPHMQEQ